MTDSLIGHQIQPTSLLPSTSPTLLYPIVNHRYPSNTHPSIQPPDPAISQVIVADTKHLAIPHLSQFHEAPSTGTQQRVNGENDEESALPENRHSSENQSRPKKKKPGRKSGSKNFSVEETNAILGMMEKFHPIGRKGWLNVAARYNAFAESHGFVVRETKAIKAKFEALVRSAKVKPAGDPKPQHNTPYAMALRIKDLIAEKSRTLTIDHSEFEETDPISLVDHASNEDSEVLSTKNSGLMIKNEDSPLRSGDDTQKAINLMTATLSANSPAALQEHDDRQMAQSMHLIQIAGYQQEIRDLRAEISRLNERVMAETRRADRAEDQLKFRIELEPIRAFHVHRHDPPDELPSLASQFHDDRGTQSPQVYPLRRFSQSPARENESHSPGHSL